MKKAEIFFSILPIDISQVSTIVIFHILQAMLTRKIVKMVNLGEGN